MSELSPHEKAKRTKLINEGCEVRQIKKEAEARLKEIEEELWPFAETEIGDGKSCTFTTGKGSCEVQRAVTITIPEESLGNLRAALGERFDEMVKVEEKQSVTSSLKRVLSEPQPNERTLADQVRTMLRFRELHRFSFKLAA